MYISKLYQIKPIYIFFFLYLIQIGYNVINFYLGQGYPCNWFLFDPNDRFADILKTSDSFGVFETWHGDNKYYLEHLCALPPLQLLIHICYGYLCKIVSYINVSPLCLFIIIQIIVISIMVWILKRYKVELQKMLICLLNYGLVFFLDRGNVSVLLLPMLLIYFSTDNLKTAVLMLVLATSIKITPIFFLIYCLLKFQGDVFKVVKWFFVFLVLINIPAILLTKITLSGLSLDYNFTVYIEHSRKYLQLYLEQGWGWAYGSSLITLLAQILQYLNMHLFHTLPSNEIIPYLSKISLLLLIMSYVFIYWLREYFKDNQFLLVLFLVTSFIVFSPVTADYFLALLAIPLLKTNFEQEKSEYVLLIILLLVPKNYFIYTTSIQVFLNPIILLAILYKIIKQASYALSK